MLDGFFFLLVLTTFEFEIVPYKGLELKNNPNEKELMDEVSV